MDADDLSLLDAVIAEGSITVAARKLDLPKTTVSRRLKRLESAAGQCREKRQYFGFWDRFDF